jgi:hypothetical protein
MEKCAFVGDGLDRPVDGRAEFREVLHPSLRKTLYNIFSRYNN